MDTKTEHKKGRIYRCLSADLVTETTRTLITILLKIYKVSHMIVSTNHPCGANQVSKVSWVQCMSFRTKTQQGKTSTINKYITIEVHISPSSAAFSQNMAMRMYLTKIPTQSPDAQGSVYTDQSGIKWPAPLITDQYLLITISTISIIYWLSPIFLAVLHTSHSL